ncbi:MAG: hypothetical protein [Circular genetic element sp.]|nr:MAG: hypothetical protein [Circular genetic element sp.]
MAGEVHLLTTFQGSYAAARLAEETWQFGIRWRLSTQDADPVGTLPTDWAPVAATINRTETDWKITGNWRMEGPGPTSFSADDWLNDQVAPAVSALLKTAYFSSSALLDRINVYPIGNTGRAIPAPPYASGSPVTLTWNTAARPKGTGNTNNVPLQVTAVASFRTQQVGRRGRGRIYLPVVTATDIVTSGFYDSSKVPVVSKLVAQFLTDASYEDNDPTTIRVNPIVTGAPYSDYALINLVRVGDVFDTQRRRRKSVPEIYYDEPVPQT